MAIDSTKSFEVSENGITIDSGTGIWIGGGDAVPTHSAPEGSRYFRTSPEDMYVQEGPGPTNNWVIFEGGGGAEEAVYASAKADHTGAPVSYDLALDTWTKFTDFNLETESTAATVDLVGQRIDINNVDGDGVYALMFTMNAVFNSAGKFHVAVYKNGSIIPTTEANGDFSNGDNDFVTGSCMISLVNGDYLELYIKSSNLNQDPDIESSTLNIHKVSGGSTGPQGPAGADGADGALVHLGAWVTSTSYSVGDGVQNDGSSYTCFAAHTSSAGDEPGVGGSWTSYWYLMASAGQGQSRIDISVHPHNDDKKSTASATYESQARFIWGGSTLLGTPSKMYSNSFQDAAGSGQVRIYDLTNSLVIAESASITSTSGGNIVDLGTISNISAGQAVWEIQNKGDGTNVNNISSVSVEF